MDTPFIYDKYVTGKHFIKRKDDCTVLANHISQKNHVSIYDIPKSGKESLIQQSLFNLNIANPGFISREISLFTIRQTPDFLTLFGETIIRAFCTTPNEYQQVVEKYFKGTNFIFDQERYSNSDRILSIISNIDKNDIETILRFPHIISNDMDKHLVFIIHEFQNIEFLPDAYNILKIFEKTVSQYHQQSNCSFIFCGSMVNGMKDIFERRRIFYRNVQHVEIHQAEEKDIIEYIVKGFLTGGKVIEKQLLVGICNIFRKHLGYINHFTYICDAMSKGYIVESTLNGALNHLLSIHEPRFIYTMNNLTTNQLHLLKAILDGKTKFSSAGIIEEYNLNSSANVKRIREALMKKEVISFNEKDEPYILDPLFEYWVKKYFYHNK